MAVVFFGKGDEDMLEKVGKVENGKIIEDPDNELENLLDGLPLQDGYLSAKFDNVFLDARLTEDVWEKELNRVYIESDLDIPDDAEIKESEYGAYYYEE